MERFQRNIYRFVDFIDFASFLVKELGNLAAFLTLAPHRKKLETKIIESYVKNHVNGDILELFVTWCHGVGKGKFGGAFFNQFFAQDDKSGRFRWSNGWPVDYTNFDGDWR
jgi:hypothetical protein